MAKLTKDEVLAKLAHSGDRYDVIVLGGGPAGIGAALAAAMCGAKVCILEQRAFFGGVAAVSGWMPMNRILLPNRLCHIFLFHITAPFQGIVSLLTALSFVLRNP